MVDYYGLGVLTPGLGIFHLVFSYSGKITLSVLGDRDIMPDPEFYHDCLVASYEEIYAACLGAGSSRGKQAVAAKAKIKSPKRARPGKPKAGKAATKAKAAVKPKAKAKAKAKAKPKAKPKNRARS